MSGHYSQETFFRPDEVRRECSALPAPIYNQCRRLLGRAKRGCVFVPIREMQFVAVIDAEEVIFIDSQTGHLVVNGLGGRPILLSWRFGPAGERESLTEPVAFEVIHYRDGLDEVQRRLIGAFNKALGLLEERSRGADAFSKGATIVSLTS